jgi:hypothetical protein
MTWTEGRIGRILARHTFKSDLCVLPNCTWTGDEIDLLVVTRDLRIIDVEIKVSRADLKQDRDKSKWWHQPWGDWVDGKWVQPAKIAKPWPRKVWKHYYAMPAALWTDALLDFIQPVSGVLLVDETHRGTPTIECVKRAKPCRDVSILTAEQVVHIARLASLRMWDAYRDLERRERDEAKTAAIPKEHVA